MYYTDSDRSVFLSSELMTKMTQKKQRHIVSLTMACHFAIINRNEVKMSANYFPTHISPEGPTIFPRQRALFLTVRQLFSNNRLYTDKRNNYYVQLTVMQQICIA